jgi:hypothetical protein
MVSINGNVPDDNIESGRFYKASSQPKWNNLENERERCKYLYPENKIRNATFINNLRDEINDRKLELYAALQEQVKFHNVRITDFVFSILVGDDNELDLNINNL